MGAPGVRRTGRVVSRVLFVRFPDGWSSVWDGRRRPPRAAYPRLPASPLALGDGVGGAGRTSPLIWPCSDWGLPCRRCYQRRGGLLPHRFTLTLSLRLRSGSWRSVFCCPVRRLAAPRRYLAVYPMELGLSSRKRRRPAASPRPSHPARSPVRSQYTGRAVRPLTRRRTAGPAPDGPDRDRAGGRGRPRRTGPARPGTPAGPPAPVPVFPE